MYHLEVIMKQEIQNMKTEILFNLQDLVAYNKDHIAIGSKG